MSDPAFYQQDRPIIAEAQEKLARVEADLAAAYARWEELEERR